MRENFVNMICFNIGLKKKKIINHKNIENKIHGSIFKKKSMTIIIYGEIF